MKLHRFYIGDSFELKHDLWVHDERLVHQWGRVLRMRPGNELVLFDGVSHDRLYEITEISNTEVHLKQVTDFVRKVPTKDVTLLWSLLKKDKNDWVLQKCTELGVSHFVPVLAERSEKTGFNIDRATKILIEATEQCGRSDVPSIREPLHVETVLQENAAQRSPEQFLVCEQEAGEIEPTIDKNKPISVLVGPEGGWSENEKQLFQQHQVQYLDLHNFTLRAETAAVAVAAKLL